MTDRHDKALEAAANALACLQYGQPIGTPVTLDEWHRASAEAAILAFLGAVEATEGMVDAALDATRPDEVTCADAAIAATRAALAQLRRELEG